jgi:hypothetical protein
MSKTAKIVIAIIAVIATILINAYLIHEMGFWAWALFS